MGRPEAADGLSWQATSSWCTYWGRPQSAESPNGRGRKLRVVHRAGHKLVARRVGCTRAGQEHRYWPIKEQMGVRSNFELVGSIILPATFTGRTWGTKIEKSWGKSKKHGGENAPGKTC